MKQSDHIGNEGEVIGLDLPVQDYLMANDSDTLMLGGNDIQYIPVIVPEVGPTKNWHYKR